MFELMFCGIVQILALLGSSQLFDTISSAILNTLLPETRFSLVTQS